MVNWGVFDVPVNRPPVGHEILQHFSAGIGCLDEDKNAGAHRRAKELRGENVVAVVGKELRKREYEAEVKSVDDVSSLAGYDGFVIGSALYAGGWLKAAAEFLRSNQEVLANPAVDFAVTGEGEISGLELLEALRAGTLPPSISGVSWRRDGSATVPEIRSFIEDLDTLPHPAWDLLDLEFYFYNPHKPAPMNLYQKNARSAPVFTSRGCPYTCKFCSITNMYGRTFRRFPLERILADLSALRERGTRAVFLADDNLTYDIEHFRSVCRAIADAGLTDLDRRTRRTTTATECSCVIPSRLTDENRGPSGAH